MLLFRQEQNSDSRDSRNVLDFGNYRQTKNKTKKKEIKKAKGKSEK